MACSQKASRNGSAPRVLGWLGRGEEQHTASHRWLGWRPGADPLGKDFTPFSSANSERVIAGGVGPEGATVGGA